MAYDILQSSTQSVLLFFMTDSTDHISAKTGLTTTVTISKNGGSFGSPSGAVAEIANGWYKVAGNATDTNTLGPLALHATATGADACDIIVANIVSYNPQSATNLGLSGLPTANPGAANGVLIAGTNAPVTITGSGDALTITSSGGNGNGINISANGTGDAIKATAGATGNALELIGGGTSGDGLKVTTTSGHGMNIAATGTSKHGITATGGNAGTSDGIKGVAGSGGVDIRGNITGNITGNLSGSAGSVTGAVGSVTGNVGGSVASVTATVTTDVTQTTRAEPAQGAPAATATPASKIDYIYKFLRNKVTTTATQVSIFNDDAATVDHKSTISDDGTTFTRGEFATGP